jgi:hypothetical protein
MAHYVILTCAITDNNNSKHAEFAATEYYGAGIGLIACYENGDQKELTEFCNKTGVFKYLNNQVYHPYHHHRSSPICHVMSML